MLELNKYYSMQCYLIFNYIGIKVIVYQIGANEDLSNFVLLYLFVKIDMLPYEGEIDIFQIFYLIFQTIFLLIISNKILKFIY